MTPFEGLCGFRPLTEIQKYLNTVPEITGVIGQDAVNAIASGSGLEKLVLGSRDGAVVRVLASHQCGASLTVAQCVIYRLSLWLVVALF